MSLVFFLWVFLSFEIQLYVLAGPSPSTIPLPPFLSNIIPTCAQDCLTNFITASFPTSICPSQQDRSCLCTRNSRSGFTLGEGALQCVASSCIGEYESDLRDAYELCSGIASAIPMTHETITVTVQLLTTVTPSIQIDPPTTSERASFSSATSCITKTMASSTSSNMFPSSSDHSSTFQSIPTSIITASGSPTIPHLISTDIPSGSLIPSASTTAFAAISSSSSSHGAIPAASVTSPSKSILTRPQIAGVATAGAATAAIAIAILAFFFCCRKRRKNRDSNSSFGQDQLPDMSQFPPSALAPTVKNSEVSRQQVSEAPPKAQQVLGVPSRYNEQTWDAYNDATNPVDGTVGAVPRSGHSTQSSQETPPPSATSYRTTSRLLPDKPTISSLYPAPLNPGIRLVAPEPPPKPQKTFQPKISYQPDPFIDHSNDPRARMYAMERSARHAQLPLVLTAGREQDGGSSRTLPSNSQISEPPPVHSYHGPRWEGALPLSTSVPHDIQRKPLPQNLDISENPRNSTHSSFDPYAGTYVQSARSGSLARRSKGVRPATYLTMGSDTSFEDDCDEADEPSKPNRALSPVVEQDTPRIRSPISNIRYPPIPGAEVSAIQRRQSPPSPTRRPTRRPNIPPAAQNTRVRHVDFRLPPQQNFGMRPTTQAQGPPGPTTTRAANPQDPRRAPAASMNDPRTRQQQYPVVEGNTESAKWKILCGPPRQDDLIINLGSAYTGAAASGKQ